MIQLILGLIVTLLSALISIYEKWRRRAEPEYRKRNNLAIALLLIAFCGGFLSFFAGFDAIKQKRLSEIVASKRQERVDSQTTTIYKLEKLNHDLINKTIEYNKRLDSSSYENYSLSKYIIGQTKELKDYETGKGSFCHFDLGFMGPTPNSYRFVLYSSGNNPMADVVARVVDVYDLTNNPLGTIIHIGKIYPKIHTARIFETSYTPLKPDSIWLNIFFQTGSREIVEELKQVRRNGKWIVSKTIFEDGKTVYTKIDKGFPGDF
jgi:cell division protein FtsB